MVDKDKSSKIKNTLLSIAYTFMIGNMVYQVYTTLKKIDQLNDKGHGNSD